LTVLECDIISGVFIIGNKNHIYTQSLKSKILRACLKLDATVRSNKLATIISVLHPAFPRKFLVAALLCKAPPLCTVRRGYFFGAASSNSWTSEYKHTTWRHWMCDGVMRRYL